MTYLIAGEARVVHEGKHPLRGRVDYYMIGENVMYWRDPEDTTSPYAGQFVIASPSFRDEVLGRVKP